MELTVHAPGATVPLTWKAVSNDVGVLRTARAVPGEFGPELTSHLLRMAPEANFVLPAAEPAVFLFAVTPAPREHGPLLCWASCCSRLWQRFGSSFTARRIDDIDGGL